MPKKLKPGEAKARKDKYDMDNSTVIAAKLWNAKDQDIIQWLNGKNKAKAIKDAIRSAIAAEKENN